MIKERNIFCLDRFYDGEENIPTGLAIKVKSDDGCADMAYVKWSDKYESCYFETVSDLFQTYVIDFDRLADFVYLLDEAYDSITAAKKAE